MQALLEAGESRHCVVADAGYGVDSAFRQGLTAMGLSYVVGITSAVRVWPPGQQPLPPKPWTGKGRPPVATRRSPEHRPLSVKKLALALPPEVFTELTWRQGTNEPLSGRFAAVRVRLAGSVSAKQRLHPQQWLLIEWPSAQDEPTRYWLSTLVEDTPLPELVRIAHLRWRIERDYQDLKQDLGLGHYEGRGWRGFHHHASLSIAAYGFLLGQRLRREALSGPDGQGKKNLRACTVPALPADYRPRGRPARAAACGGVDHDAASSTGCLPDA